MSVNGVDGTILDRLASDLGDPAPVKDLIETFLEETRAIIARIQSGVQQKRPADVAMGAHSLKSSSAMLGALQLSALAKELETIARSGSLDGVPERLQLLLQIFPQVEKSLKAWPGK